MTPADLPGESSRTTPTAQAQTALDEKVVEDSELEAVLEDREIARGKAGEAKKKVETLTEVAKGKLTELGLSDGDVFRVGRFRVSQTAIKGRAVAFETSPSSRLSIGVAKGEDD